MTNLLDLQSAFRAALLDMTCPVPAAIARREGIAPERRFAVYRNNVVMSLTEVLQAYFPVIVRLVGAEYFAALARAFIVSSPPRSPILSRYGAGFAHFLSNFEPVADLPYLPDVASLEWARLRAYHAADSSVMDAKALAAIPPHLVGATRIALHPSARVVSSAHPIFSIWRTNTFDNPVIAIGSDVPGEAVLVVRTGSEVRVLKLIAGADRFLQALMEGETLAAATAAGRAGTGEFDVEWVLAALIELEAIAGVGATDSVDPSRPDLAEGA